MPLASDFDFIMRTEVFFLKSTATSLALDKTLLNSPPPPIFRFYDIFNGFNQHPFCKNSNTWLRLGCLPIQVTLRPLIITLYSRDKPISGEKGTCIVKKKVEEE